MSTSAIKIFTYLYPQRSASVITRFETSWHVVLSILGVYLTSKYKTRPELRNASPEMCLSSFSEMKDASSSLHILPSLLLALVAAIPNHTLRYTVLGLFLGLFVLSSVHLRSPSTQLRHLALLIDQTENHIRHAMAQCPRDYFSLREEMGRLLE
jgi:hypothetical protein